jgi:hypothetical protein
MGPHLKDLPEGVCEKIRKRIAKGFLNSTNAQVQDFRGSWKIAIITTKA